METMDKLRTGKENHIVFLSDTSDAFDRLKKQTVQQALQEQTSQMLAKGFQVRLGQVRYATKIGQEWVVVTMPQGVPQGDPCGPKLYVAAYEKVINDEKERLQKEKLMFQIPEVLQEHTEATEIDMATHCYLDDHLEFILEEKPQENIREITGIIKMQTDAGLLPQYLKMAVLPSLNGKGCKKKLKACGKQLGVGQQKIPVKRTEKYLGLHINNEGLCGEVVEHRVAQATKAMNQLCRYWKSNWATLQQKIRIYEVMVKSVLLYGLETLP